jgi:hypothetical protein
MPLSSAQNKSSLVELKGVHFGNDPFKAGYFKNTSFSGITKHKAREWALNFSNSLSLVKEKFPSIRCPPDTPEIWGNALWSCNVGGPCDGHNR